MERVKRTERGVTLLDLIVSVVIGAIVLFAASKLLINFGNVSFSFVKSEASLMGTAVGAFEEISGKITEANDVAIFPAAHISAPSIAYPSSGCANGSCIQIRVSPTNLPATSDHSADSVFTYWLSGRKIFKSIYPGSVTGSAIAGDIDTLSFQQPPGALNKVIVQVTASAASGSTAAVQTSKENLVTTATMRSRSA